MINYRIIERPAFEVIGKKVWIAGIDDNEAFGRFWDFCRKEGLFTIFDCIRDHQPGAQTNGLTLGVSRVELDPTQRSFYYMIAIEKPKSYPAMDDLEAYMVPATPWAVFECHGKVPEAIVEAEMFAFMEWLPASDYVHANAPEMEVYPQESGGQNDDQTCEFWLPIKKKDFFVPG
jgi:AraC family transcriptional regulator